ncbi:MAG: hypothetical protein ACHREM_11865 [Polyangiales bacterium]
MHLPEMTVDSTDVYVVLLQRLRLATPVLSDATLEVATDIPRTSSRTERALTIVARRCRALGLPTLSALVVRESTGVPRSYYFDVAHGLDFDADRPAATFQWTQEVTAVLRCAASYPTRL